MSHNRFKITAAEQLTNHFCWTNHPNGHIVHNSACIIMLQRTSIINKYRLLLSWFVCLPMID